VGKVNTIKIHIDQNRIAQNAHKAPSERFPPITCWDGSEVAYGFQAAIQGPSRLVYSPDEPLTHGEFQTGAKMWLETESKVILT
jgi:hypothetical protein